MLRTPRSSPRSGRSSQVIVLAIAGLGTAVFLLFLFPRMTSSRAAAPRVELPSEPAAPLTAREEPAPRPVVLPNPMGNGMDVDDMDMDEVAAQPELQPNGVKAMGLAADASAAGAEGQALLAAGAKPPVEGPKLTYAKREGKTEVLAPGEMRQKNKEKAKERLEKATEKALAEGKPLPENLRAKTAAKGNGEKPTRPNAKGKKKREPKPQDG